MMDFLFNISEFENPLDSSTSCKDLKTKKRNSRRPIAKKYGLVNLSKNLEKQTIFEGVETKVQRDFLKKIKCDQVQGYFYSKPLTEDDFLQFLKQHL